MKSPTERIMGYAEAKPEATPIQAKDTVRSVYLTSGPDRILHFGAHRVELLHAPSWQLAAPNRNAGTVIRAVAWLGPNEIEESLDAVLPKLSKEDLSDLSAVQAVMPEWMAEPLSRRLVHR